MSGRNDPCPCGSGKKMKKCCGGAKPSRTYQVANEAEGVKKISMPVFKKVVLQKDQEKTDKS